MRYVIAVSVILICGACAETPETTAYVPPPYVPPSPGSAPFASTLPKVWHPDSSNHNATNDQFQRAKAGCLVTVDQIIEQDSSAVGMQQLADTVMQNCLRAAGWEPGEGTPPPEKIPSAEQNKAMKVVFDCMSNNNHDPDKPGDVAIIARSLVSACSKEWEYYFQTMGVVVADQTPVEQLKIINAEIYGATKVVLHQREVADKMKQCMDQAGRIGKGVASAHPELLDRILKKLDEYSKQMINYNGGACPPFVAD